MIAIIDYGVGNLFSLASSFASIGADARVCADADEIVRADRIILPGVGAFADARAKLAQTGLEEVLRARVAAGVPVMGICLGMQLLFDKSYEFGTHDGLGLISGAVVPIDSQNGALKIPHIGWNALDCTQNTAGVHPLFAGIAPGSFVYFVHSFFATNCAPDTIAITEYGDTLTAAVARGNVMGCQFHPEKSGAVGLDILRAFCASDFADKLEVWNAAQAHVVVGAGDATC